MTAMRDRTILRELAARYAEWARSDVQRERRDLWRRHNSLHKVRPPIYVRQIPWSEAAELRSPSCVDPLLRQYEQWFRQMLFRASIDDDYIYEPWVTVAPVYRCTGWGVEVEHERSKEPGGSFKIHYAIRSLEDIEKLRRPWHEIDEPQTARRVEQIQEAIGDLIAIDVDRAPAYRMWGADISTELGYLRGIENIMLDMADNPEWLHRLAQFMSDGVLKTHEEAEAKGDWGLSAHQNQAMPYAEELADPQANARGVSRSQLWCFMAAQEFTLVSPAQHEEFLLRYQLPILKKFGLTAYGCCEDLTRKIDMLRQIPNLRRIAVAPVANVRRCAEQIGRAYVLSYRPSPAEMVCCGFDPGRVRAALREALAACKGCFVDITLKDVQTVEGDLERLRAWARIAKEVAQESA